MGSSAFGIYIQTEGHEKLFYKAIKDYILSLSPTITCAEDPEEEFNADLKGSGHIPTLNFSINGTHIFKLYRPMRLRDLGMETPVKGICFSMDAVGSIPHGVREINFRPSDTDTGVTQINTGLRGIWISHIINTAFVYFNFGSFNQSRREESSENGGPVYCSSDGKFYLGLVGGHSGTLTRANIFDLSGVTLYDATATGLVGSFLSRFTYAAPPGSIDYIKSSIYMNNNEKVFENRAIYDSTTVTIGDTVSLKDGAYVAIGTHQLVKVS